MYEENTVHFIFGENIETGNAAEKLNHELSAYSRRELFSAEKEKTITHSAAGSNFLLKIISRNSSIIQQIRDKFSSNQILREPELETVLDAYIAKGFGYKVARDFFR